MLPIQNNKDLKIAYGFIKILEASEKQNPNAQKYIKKLKQKIRAYQNQPIPEERIIKEYGIDGYIILIPLPENLTSYNEACEYFEDNKYIHPTYSIYDCTGRPFTSWYKIFKRHGKFYAYHSVCYDV